MQRLIRDLAALAATRHPPREHLMTATVATSFESQSHTPPGRTQTSS
ncbi:hypothetical protein ACFVYC_13560 [Pseudarthrobacter sp. NPDC058329]